MFADDNTVCTLSTNDDDLNNTVKIYKKRFSYLIQGCLYRASQ